jgi:pilus assembly protein CpaF
MKLFPSSLHKSSNLKFREDTLDLPTITDPSVLLMNSPIGEHFGDSVTDIAYNGNDFFAQDNITGRQKLDLKMTQAQVFDLIKQIANLTGKNFSYTSPVLEVSFGKFRLSAMHSSIAKSNQENTITFSLRYLSPRLLIKNADNEFAPSEIFRLLKHLIDTNRSIVICGVTGCGKTEFQKYLVSLISKNSKIIMIEDTYETFVKELFPHLDISVWLSEEDNIKKLTISQLIKFALRNNPDWMIVAEVRGNEAIDLIESLSTGHPCITTIHAEHASECLNRLMLLASKSLTMDQMSVQKSLVTGLSIAVKLNKIYSPERGRYIRYIQEIVEYHYDNGIVPVKIFEANYITDKDTFIYEYAPLSYELAKLIHLKQEWYKDKKQ